MIQAIALGLICLFGPLGIMWLTYRSLFLRKVGNIIIAYIIGCTIGLSGLLSNTEEVKTVQTIVSNLTIPFAIPLMLFSSNVKAWAHLAPSFVKSLLLGILACIIAVFLGFYIFGRSNPELYANIGGMLSGLYTGGTTNLASLKIALNVDDATYLLVHTYSILVSAIYLIIVVIFGKRILLLFMPDFASNKDLADSTGLHIDNHDTELFLGLFTHRNLPHLFKSLLLSLIVILLGFGISQLFDESLFMAVFILSISLLSIFASLTRPVRALERTFETGTYFILMFSLAVSSQVSVDMFIDIDLSFFLFTACVTLGALFFHVLLSALVRIDTDTTLVTSISLLCSPPFTPVMAGALHNRAVLGPGIAVGLIGYAIGTYLGFALAKVLLLVFC